MRTGWSATRSFESLRMAVSQSPGGGRRLTLLMCCSVGWEHHVDLEFVFGFDVDMFDQEFHQAPPPVVVHSAKTLSDFRAKAFHPL